MDWFKKHADSIATISTIVVAVVWMNGRFSSMEKEMNQRFSSLEMSFSRLEKDISIIKTVLVNIPPAKAESFSLLRGLRS